MEFFYLENRDAVRAGAMGAIAPVDFQKQQIAFVNLKQTQVKDKEITQKMYRSKHLEVLGIIQNCFKIQKKQQIY